MDWVGVIVGVTFFLASFGPSLVPRPWLAQSLVSGLAGVIGYLLGLTLQTLVGLALDAVGMRVQVQYGGVTAQAAALGLLIAIACIAIWWRAHRAHQNTARLLGLRPQPLWQDIAATAIAFLWMGVVATLFMVLEAAGTRLSHALARWLPGVLSGVAALILLVLVLGWANVAIGRRALERISRSAERTNAAIPTHRQPPTSFLRSGSPKATQPWEMLGRQGRYFVTGGPHAGDIEQVTGHSACEPIRVYAGRCGQGVSDGVQVAMAEAHRTHAFDRGHILLVTATGRGWIDEFAVQSFEYLTGGDCATIACQYSSLPSGIAFLFDRDSPRMAGRLLLEAVEAELAGRHVRPQLHMSGESLGAFGSLSAFEDGVDMLSRVDSAVWVGTPGVTRLWRQLTDARMPGSPEITPVVHNAHHLRFATRPQELYEDAYGRDLPEWQHPRVAFLQHASDPIVWWQPSLAWREPDWIRERAGRDVSPQLRWWPAVTFIQLAVDMALAFAPGAGHGHFYQDEVVEAFAAVLGSGEHLVKPITEAIHADLIRTRTGVVSPSGTRV